ncbi:MAG: DUF6088 family protein [Bacteroidota bacterium]
MNIAATINKQIEIIEPGKLFSYRDFKLPDDRMVAIANTLSRLASKGIIKRFKKGKYFKPKQGMFGEMSLSQSQILESLLKENGNRVGYITGTMAYNQMYLTTQIPNEYVIATYEQRRPIQNGGFKARFVKAYSEITENNIYLLQLLDAIKDIQVIPATGANTALKLIKGKLKTLPLSEQKKLTELALNYPPATKALLGAMFELMRNKSAADKLYKTLNPLSKYKIGIEGELLSNKNKWKIE